MSDEKIKDEMPQNFLFDFSEQTEARRFLWQSYISNRISSAYLFTGQSGVGKFVMAMEFIKFLKCPNRTDGTYCGECNSCRTITNWNNPDILILFPMPSTVWERENLLQQAYEDFRNSPYMRPAFSKSTQILLNMIRDVQHFLATPSTLSGGKFVIVADAHKMNKQAANAFLKTLEEPPQDAHIILTTDRAESLLPTILSRTQILRFRRMSTAQIVQNLVQKHNFSPELAERAAKVSEGSVAAALQFVSADFSEIRDNALGIFKCAADGDLVSLWEWANSAPSNSDYLVNILKILHSLARDTSAYLSGAEILNSDSEKIISSAAGKLKTFENCLELMHNIQNLRSDSFHNPQYKLIYGAIVSALENSFGE
ncbi:DNA polymerase III subunit [bacterium]|nr:DNA polymerase III subunit [bacterium]